MGRKLGIAIILIIGFATTFKTFWKPEGARSFASVTTDKAWTISAYHYNDPKNKVYVTIRNDLIEEISDTKPDGFVLETENWILPGLIDLHNHLKYNILPLWPLAKGQFWNRFEWRDYKPYKNYASFNMKAIPANKICSAVRWAELKQLVAGATTVQGIGADFPCGSGFGPRNVDLKGEMKPGDGRAMALIETFSPDLMGPVYYKQIKPLMTEKKIGYSDAVAEVIRTHKVDQWLNDFRTLPKNLNSALILLTGHDFKLAAEATFDSAKADISQYLTDTSLSEKPIADILKEMNDWIHGGGYLKGYLNITIKPDEEVLENRDVPDLFKSSAILHVSKVVREYVADIEVNARQKIFKYIETQKDPLGIIIHLSEGRRTDSFSGKEYELLGELEISKPGMMIIHGVSLTEEQFKEMKAKDQSLIWSPFSNLLLYGETVDIAKAKASGVNIALAPDWSISGSKNTLDELKLARMYLDNRENKSISNKDLFEMVTLNAAKALQMQDVLGSIAENRLADFFLLEKKSDNPYDDLLNSTTKNIALVSVAGVPYFGDIDLITALSKEFQDTEAVEQIDVTNDNCKFSKALRKPSMLIIETTYKDSFGIDLRSISSLETALNGMFADYETKVRADLKDTEGFKNLTKLDSMFSCEDKTYLTAFEKFIAEDWDHSHSQFEIKRLQHKLKPNYNPWGISPAPE